MKRFSTKQLAVWMAAALGAAAAVWMVNANDPLTGSAGRPYELIVKEGGRFSLVAKNAPVADILRDLRDKAGIKLSVDEKLKDRISLDLRDATAEDIVKAIATSHALEYAPDGQGGYKLVGVSATSRDGVAPTNPTSASAWERYPLPLRKGQLSNIEKPTQAMVQRVVPAILLENALIDSRTLLQGKDVAVPASLKSGADEKNFIVQFNRSVRESDKLALAAMGAKVSHYIPNDALFVSVDPANVASLRTLADVLVVEPYHPYFKLSHDLAATASGVATAEEKARAELGRYKVMTVGYVKDVTALDSKVSVQRTQTLRDHTVATVELSASNVYALARQTDVLWIEPAIPNVALNDNGNRRIRASSLKKLHPTLTGKGVTVGVTDSGVDFNHQGFSLVQGQATSTGLNSRIVAYFIGAPGVTSDGIVGDSNGHGTHVSGTVLGNGALSQTVPKAPGSGSAPYATNQFAGVAPDAKLVMVEDFNSIANQTQLLDAWSAGARLNNNSWGANTPQYTIDCYEFDLLVPDIDFIEAGPQPFIPFFAAGNAGNGNDDGFGGFAGSVGSPGSAKNVITVGALEQVRLAENYPNGRPETDSDYEVASYSSRGPVQQVDLRRKPDVMAVGSYVLSVQSKDTMPDDLAEPLLPSRDYRYDNLDSGTNYAFESGTSMATPMTTGAGALLYQWFTNTYGRAPSAAMMKAMMINSARNVNSLLYPKAPGIETYYPPVGTYVPGVYVEVPVYQGWGAVDVVRAVDGPQIHPTDQTLYLDEGDTTPLNSGDVYTKTIQVNPGEGGLKITLVYSDFPGTPGNGLQLVNNLDIRLIAPDGRVYFGNYYGDDGVHSKAFGQLLPTFSADGVDNIEQIFVPEPAAGQYTIRVNGFNVPAGPQSFALAVMKGVALEGRAPGNAPDIALDTNNNPVIAFSATDAGGHDQVYVRHWEGPIGDATTFGTWKRLEDQWYGYRNSGNMDGTGVSRTQEDSQNPSVAVDRDRIVLAWEEHGQTTSTPSRIYARMFNGADWVELDNSGRGYGVSGTAFELDALDPVIRVIPQSRVPVLAWRQKMATGTKVLVKLWGGSSWFDLNGSSSSNGISGAGTLVAASLDLAIDSTGLPVVAWEEQTTQKIHIRRWNGSNAWADLGSQGAAPYSYSPKLAAGPNGEIYLAWVQTPNGAGTNYYFQVNVAKYQGGVWSQLGGSTNYPGISQNFSTTNRPYTPSISVGRNGDVYVGWAGGAADENSILVKKWNGSQWVGVAGAGVPPGVAFTKGVSATPIMTSDSNGVPYVAFANEGVAGSEVMTYALSSDRTAPQFQGLITAVGSTNGSVQLGWLAATDYSTNIIYRIYRTSSSVPCGSLAACDPAAVFSNLIATVTNVLSFNVTGLVNGQVYCFGVRAVDENGQSDANTVTRSAGPVASGAADDDGDCLNNQNEQLAGSEPCVKDTDGDGMWDGWEWVFSTNNPSFVGTNGMKLLDNGIDNVRTLTQNDGTAVQSPLADLDGDGLPNLDEFLWWKNHGGACPISSTNSPDPTKFDTDGDGMSDGWEVQNNLSPVSNVGTNGAAGDPDGDGVNNLVEYTYGSDPNRADTDGDGLSDFQEINVLGTDPVSTDSDLDGLDDDFELNVYTTDPRKADSQTNSLVNDGDIYQLGWTNRAQAVPYEYLLSENFEGSSRTNWTHNSASLLLPFDGWHLTATEPQGPFTNRPVKIQFMYQHTTNVAYRMARDTSATPTTPGTNLNADYNVGQLVQCALNSPRLDASTNSSLFVEWNEYYETEPFFDTVQIQGRAGANTNWFILGSQLSGYTLTTNPFTATTTNGWVHRRADASRFVGQNNVQFRFLFAAQNRINNNFRGWWVDDVVVFGGTMVTGWVRDVRGRPVDGGQVLAIGLGGVTNLIQGHRYSGAGKVFAESKTSADGSFVLNGLPRGLLYAKAASATLSAEFFNGLLFTPPYAFGAGIATNAGLADSDLARQSPQSRLDTKLSNRFTDIFFELDQGKGRAYLGVAGVATNLQLDHAAIPYWNGSTSAPALVGWVPSVSAGSLTNNRPDWETHPLAPRLYGDAAPGTHWIMQQPSIGLPVPVLEAREGETAIVSLGTNQPLGLLDIRVESSSGYSMWIDGAKATSGVPGTVSLRAGTHYVSLVPTNAGGNKPGVKSAYVQGGLIPTRLVFATNDLSLVPGILTVVAVDLKGNAVSGAEVRVNGTIIGSNDVVSGSSTGTPLTVKGLLPGDHYVSVRAPGYRGTELRKMSQFSGASNTTTFILYDEDIDYDGVGDSVEILGYTNVFLYSRSNDPDADGLSNLQEFNLYREFSVRVNPFNADTDGDGMSDGAEVAYDGNAGVLGLSTLATNGIQDANWMATYFSGRYLDGVNYFSLTNAVASTEGDRFEAPLVYHPLITVPTRSWAQTMFTNIPPSVVPRAISFGHNPDRIIVSDTRPDVVDTDGDGMWDGFEHTYSFMPSLADPNTIVRILDPLEDGNADSDPDADGLSNYAEFLGFDGVTNLVWSNPTSADSDGDQIPDGWEMQYGFDPSNPSDAYADPDADGLVNLGEYLSGSDPLLYDTDADFLPDGDEVLVYGTDPRDFDTDDDGLIDGREVWDKNLDGIPDGGFFPSWNGGDLDNDGKVDGPTDWDTDGDGMSDGFEVLDAYGNMRPIALDPYNPFDGAVDTDGDGLSNLQEMLVQDALYGNPPGTFDPNYNDVVWQYPSDPFNADSDGDGIPDGFEVQYGLHPMDPSAGPGGSSILLYGALTPGGDPDGDGLWNDREYRIRFLLATNSTTNAITSFSTHPWNPDTDSDGLGDGEEDRSLRSNPILQDTDKDRLQDGSGITNWFGELETTPRVSEYQFVPGAITWTGAAASARVSHPVYPWIQGHLATITTDDELLTVLNLIGASSDVAVGAFGRPADAASGIAADGWHWVTYEIPTPDAAGVFPNIPPMIPPLGPPFPLTTNYLTLNNDATVNVTTQNVTGGYVIEWERVPQNSQQYDGATNDMWQLIWPAALELPLWAPVQAGYNDPNDPAPEPRWGQTATYVPVYEWKKNRNGGHVAGYKLLMDNRRLVVMGGRAGINRYDDIWEYSLYDGGHWRKSVAPLNAVGYANGLSEASSFIRFASNNTRRAACTGGFDADGEDFGEPKNRPWNVDGQHGRTYDLNFVFSGIDTAHGYYNAGVAMKTSDDPSTITERSSGMDSAAFLVISNAATINVIAGTGAVYVGSGTAVPPLGGGVTLQGFSGFTINPIPFKLQCEAIERVVLRLDVIDSSTVAIPTQVRLEVRNDVTPNVDHAEPYSANTAGANTRWTSGNNIRSSTTNVNFAANFGGTLQVDITRQFIELLRAAGQWDATRMGVLINVTNATADYLRIGAAGTSMEITYRPSYKAEATWAQALPGTFAPGSSPPSIRKSSVIAYDYHKSRVLVFGGINGNTVLSDVREGDFTKPPINEPFWYTPPSGPPARWGHQMVFDAAHNWYVLFGGFDANHRTLSDTWIYVPAAEPGQGFWSVLLAGSYAQTPPPRGGHSMIYFGDSDYTRAVSYTINNNHQQVVLFGGTDGRTYLNDTWVWDSGTFSWTLANPSGIWGSGAPSPRAFASMVYAQNLLGEDNPNPAHATAGALLFGGRVGGLPTGRDTDFDLVDDGAEHDINGATQSRDPRVNRMFQPADPRPETYPYNFIRIGSVPPGWPAVPRGPIADMESVNYENLVFAGAAGLPYEPHPLSGRISTGVSGAEPGVDGNAPEQSQLWFHRYSLENPYDNRDVWQLGEPDPKVAGTNAVPRIPYSGRWCYGTKLNGLYPNNAIMELISPLVELTLPSPDGTSVSPNLNQYYLVFHEWLDLADSNDYVRVDMLRPVTGSEILQRKSVTKPSIRVMADRNRGYNTKGDWRRVIVPVEVSANETNVYFKFTLQSDATGAAGGWYIDDVAIIQGATISGNLTNFPNGQVLLFGPNSGFTPFTNKLTDAAGNYEFGLLPDGDYVIAAGGGIIGGINVGDNSGWSGSLGSSVVAGIVVSSIAPAVSGGNVVTWPSIPGMTYRIEYSDNLFTWNPLVTLTAASLQESYIDPAGAPVRMYRVVLLNQ